MGEVLHGLRMRSSRSTMGVAGFMLSSYCGWRRRVSFQRCVLRCGIMSQACVPHCSLLSTAYVVGFVVITIEYKGITVAKLVLHLPRLKLLIRAKYKASARSRAPKNILKNPDHTRTQSHDRHKRQPSVPAQELRARKYKSCIEINAYSERLDRSLVPAPATYTHLVVHTDRQHYSRLAWR